MAHCAGSVREMRDWKRPMSRFAVFLLIAFAVPQLAAGSGLESQLEAANKECVEHISSLQGRFEFWRWISIVVTIVGGAVASLSGLKAGNSEPTEGRRWGYLALVAGALAAAAPLLPKAEEFRSQAIQADRHYVVGLKVQRQLDSLDPDGKFKTNATKYAIARFTDCVARAPSSEVPDLPEDAATSSDKILRLPPG